MVIVRFHWRRDKICRESFYILILSCYSMYASIFIKSCAQRIRIIAGVYLYQNYITLGDFEKRIICYGLCVAESRSAVCVMNVPRPRDQHHFSLALSSFWRSCVVLGFHLNNWRKIIILQTNMIIVQRLYTLLFESNEMQFNSVRAAIDDFAREWSIQRRIQATKLKISVRTPLTKYIQVV